MNFKNYIQEIQNFPTPGISFKDITPLFNDPQAFQEVIDLFAKQCEKKELDKIVCIESRGFIFGAALAYKLGLPFTLIRKKGKLPREVVSLSYDLEYRSDTIEIHKEDIHSAEKILLIDDVLATGGTAIAAKTLIEKVGGIVSVFAIVIELDFLEGRKLFGDTEVISLVHY